MPFSRGAQPARAWPDPWVPPDHEAKSPGRLIIVTGLPGSGKTTLAIRLADSMPAVRLCPDDWMIASGIDLWDEAVRSRIEGLQNTLAIDLLRTGTHVVIEWGTWAREERDSLRKSARSVGSPVELRYLTAPRDELWRRIDKRDREGRWGSRPITREDLDEWAAIYQAPTDEEQATYDQSG